MIVELMGTPGSGKSSLLPGVVAFYREHHIPAFVRNDIYQVYAARRLPGKLVRRFFPEPFRKTAIKKLCGSLRKREGTKFRSEHPALIQQVISTQQTRPPEAGVERRGILKQFDNFIENYAGFTSLLNAGDILIYDEGFAHRVVQFNASDVEKPDPSRIGNYLDLVPRPHYVIHIHAPIETCHQRVMQRGLWTHSQHKSEAEIARFIAHAHSVVQTAIAHLRQRGWNLIEVDNSSPDLAGTVVALKERLSALI